MKRNHPDYRMGRSSYRDGRGPGGRIGKEVTLDEPRWEPVKQSAEWLEYEQRETERLARMEEALRDKAQE